MAGLLAALAIGRALAPRPAAPTAFADPRVASLRIESIVMFTDIQKERLK